MATRIKRTGTKSNVAARMQLTDYESEQVKQIAVWKSRPPNAFAEMFRRITLPGVRLVERALPDTPVRVIIDQSFEIAERLACKADVARRADVEDVRDLRRKQLGECDQLAIRKWEFFHKFLRLSREL